MSGRLMSITLFAAAALILGGCQQQSKAPAQEQAAQTTSEAPATTQQSAAEMAAKAKEVVTEKVAEAKQVVTEQAAKAKEVATEEVAKAKEVVAEKVVKPATEMAATAKTVVTEQVAKMQAPAPAAAPAPAPAPVAATETFSTTKCQACHAIDQVKLGPSFKDVVAAYGTADALAKVFESGFAVKDRKIASSDAKFKSKAPLMTSQFNSLIKGHEKAAAHALFMTVKEDAFGTY